MPLLSKNNHLAIQKEGAETIFSIFLLKIYLEYRDDAFVEI